MSIINYLQTMRFTDFLDIAIVTFIIYQAFLYLKRNNSIYLIVTIFGMLMILWLSEGLHLRMINNLLRKALELGLIAIVILFQPEIRRLLEKLGQTVFYKRVQATSEINESIAQTVLACSDMSASRTGALIIFERKSDLSDVVRTGTVVNSDVNAELLKNLFFNKAPLHDGAVIIRNGRIAAAGCVLPLTHSTNLSKDLGMRHRAGIGLSEQTDALVIIVSEETGAISLAMEGMLKRHLAPAMLDKNLRSELIDEEKKDEQTSFPELLKEIKNKMFTDKKDSNEEK